jgi:hypothetical protein
MGVAYVDIPAVEGLNQYVKNHTKPSNNYSLIMEEDMTTTTVDPSKVTPASQPAVPATHSFSLPGVTGGPATTSDFAKVQDMLNTQFAKIGELTTAVAEKDKRIETLEAFQKETQDAARVDFAKGLVAAGKVAGTDEEATIEFCKGMSDDQFATYSKLMGAAPVQPILGQYGQFSQAPGTQQAAQGTPEDERKSMLIEQIQLHSRAGKTVEQIKSFKSYKELELLDAAAAAAAVAK